jgi:hypothetical protein
MHVRRQSHLRSLSRQCRGVAPARIVKQIRQPEPVAFQEDGKPGEVAFNKGINVSSLLNYVLTFIRALMSLEVPFGRSGGPGCAVGGQREGRCACPKSSQLRGAEPRFGPKGLQCWVWKGETS